MVQGFSGAGWGLAEVEHGFDVGGGGQGFVFVVWQNTEVNLYSEEVEQGLVGT